jgi:hypothetical protein
MLFPKPEIRQGYFAEKLVDKVSSTKAAHTI